MEKNILLEIEGLTIEFADRGGEMRRVVDGVTLNLERGSTLGIVGESGSGKSVSSLAIMRLLPNEHKCRVKGEIRLREGDGTINLLKLSEKEMQKIRGKRIAMIFQEPMTSLNPVKRCGEQVEEMVRLHEEVSQEEARKRTITLFEEVLLPSPERIYRSYPHELSGGQKQRVMIAMALICNPGILIADEPTTALDVTVQQTIIKLLRSLQQKRNLSILFITHDLGVVAEVADKVAVMYRGKIIEEGSVEQILQQPQEPYTRGLIACRPSLTKRPLRLPTVKDFIEGVAIQEQERVLRQYPTDETPLIEVKGLNVTFGKRKGLFGRNGKEVRAVNQISFELYQGETLGLVGESGCGKTTLGRTLLHLINQTSGSITYKGRELSTYSPKEMREMRQEMQIIFQDPYSSLNPRLTIGEAILEPLKVHEKGSRKEQRERVVRLMEQVGLEAGWYNRYPHEFSGGQRQRVCIARALIMEPQLVVCDESVSALDVSVQAQVLNLLSELKEQYGYTYLFITHDLSVAHYIADRIMVMREGQIVEIGSADEVFQHPKEEYTKRLIEAIPSN